LGAASGALGSAAAAFLTLWHFMQPAFAAKAFLPLWQAPQAWSIA